MEPTFIAYMVFFKSAFVRPYIKSAGWLVNSGAKSTMFDHEPIVANTSYMIVESYTPVRAPWPR